MERVLKKDLSDGRAALGAAGVWREAAEVVAAVVAEEVEVEGGGSRRGRCEGCVGGEGHGEEYSG